MRGSDKMVVFGREIGQEIGQVLKQGTTKDCKDWINRNSIRLAETMEELTLCTNDGKITEWLIKRW